MRRPWLAPLIPLYAAAVALRNVRRRDGRRLRWAVISVGNLSTGGAGKTPMTMELVRLLKGAGFQVDVLSRGYGREGGAPARVLPAGTAAEFGDEPLLIARETGVPVYVAAQRYEAGLLAEADADAVDASGQHNIDQGRSARAHVLDDGFQHCQLYREVDILLINRADWEDCLLPAGNLREGLQAARRANILAIPADDPGLEGELRAWGWRGRIWRLRRRMDVPRVEGAVIAFCGIARPEQFFAGLTSGGVRVAAKVVFPDHHRYSTRDVTRLLAAARSAGAAALITTAKDLVRLGGLAATFSTELPVLTAQLHIEIEDEAAAIDDLTGLMRQANLHSTL
jgi:tetraacyldisaccharide 4'-kinase